MSDSFDDRLRSGLDSSLRTEADVDAVLSGLRPSLRRARRSQQIKSGVAGLVLVAVSGGVFMVLGNGGDGVRQTVVAVAPEEEETAEPSTPTTSERPTSTAEIPTTAGTSTASTVAPTVPAEPATSSSTSTTPATTTPSTSEVSTSSSVTTSTTTVTGQTIVESTCGSIVVSIAGDDIALVGAFPEPGFVVDRKDDGPETVEVSFESPTGHCEIEAEARDGILSSEISTE